MIRAALIIAALVAPFFFPWPFAVVVAFIVSLFVPFAGVATGIIADALYHAPVFGFFPWATIAALVASALAHGVRSLAKTRIMSA